MEANKPKRPCDHDDAQYNTQYTDVQRIRGVSHNNSERLSGLLHRFALLDSARHGRVDDVRKLIAQSGADANATDEVCCCDWYAY